MQLSKVVDERSTAAGGGRHSVRVAAVLIVVGAAAAAGWLTVTEPDELSAATTPTAAEQPLPPDAAAWIRESLPGDSRLLTDGVTAPDGYPTATLASAQRWRDFDYLLTTHSDTPSPDSAAAPVLGSSLPAAIFTGLQVRRILPTAPDAAPPSRDADLDARLRAGAALLKNPDVSVLPIAATAVSRGTLDLRVVSVLTGLAAQLDITLDTVAVVAAESVAGVPARSVTIYTTDTVRAARLLTGFDAALKPDRVDVGENGAMELHWPLSFAPIPAVK